MLVMAKYIENIFVCGGGHSGTTLMLAILDSHPLISSVPNESGVFVKGYSDEEILSVVKAWRKRYNLKKEIIAEKTPSHVKRIVKIFNIFPNAKVIIMVRDGRDAACSESYRLDSFAAAVKAWKGSSVHALAHCNDPRVKLVKYEELITEQTKICVDICNFIGIPWSDLMLRHNESERKWWDTEVRPADLNKPLTGQNHKTNRNWQINQPIFDARGRWKKDMTQEQRAMFNSIAGSLLIKLGYVKNHDWVVDDL